MKTEIAHRLTDFKPAKTAPLLNDRTQCDALIAVLWALLAITLAAAATLHFRSTSERTEPDNLTGVVIEKVFTPAPEEQITLGSKGLKAEHIAGEYVLKVQVKAKNRPYDVPVDRSLYEAKSLGDSVTFKLPASERPSRRISSGPEQDMQSIGQ